MQPLLEDGVRARAEGGNRIGPLLADAGPGAPEPPGADSCSAPRPESPDTAARRLLSAGPPRAVAPPSPDDTQVRKALRILPRGAIERLVSAEADRLSLARVDRAVALERARAAESARALHADFLLQLEILHGEALEAERRAEKSRAERDEARAEARTAREAQREALRRMVEAEEAFEGARRAAQAAEERLGSALAEIERERAAIERARTEVERDRAQGLDTALEERLAGERAAGAARLAAEEAERAAAIESASRALTARFEAERAHFLAELEAARAAQATAEAARGEAEAARAQALSLTAEIAKRFATRTSDSAARGGATPDGATGARQGADGAGARGEPVHSVESTRGLEGGAARARGPASAEDVFRRSVFFGSAPRSAPREEPRRAAAPAPAAPSDELLRIEARLLLLSGALEETRALRGLVEETRTLAARAAALAGPLEEARANAALAARAAQAAAQAATAHAAAAKATAAPGLPATALPSDGTHLADAIARRIVERLPQRRAPRERSAGATGTIATTATRAPGAARARPATPPLEDAGGASPATPRAAEGERSLDGERPPAATITGSDDGIPSMYGPGVRAGVKPGDPKLEQKTGILRRLVNENLQLRQTLGAIRDTGTGGS